jgi:hypothetical protein
MRIEWFGYVLDISWAALLGIGAATFLLCAGIAWAFGRAAKLRAGPLTTSLGGGAILFALLVATVLSAIYSVLRSS